MWADGRVRRYGGYGTMGRKRRVDGEDESVAKMDGIFPGMLLPYAAGG